MATKNKKRKTKKKTAKKGRKKPEKELVETGERDESGRFLPGHAPLPGGGRPAGSLDFMAIVRRKAEETGHDLDTVVWATARATYRDALKGNTRAQQLIIDRLCGQQKQQLEVDSNSTATVNMGSDMIEAMKAMAGSDLAVAAMLDKIEQRTTDREE